MFISADSARVGGVASEMDYMQDFTDEDFKYGGQYSLLILFFLLFFFYQGCDHILCGMNTMIVH